MLLSNAKNAIVKGKLLFNFKFFTMDTLPH